MESGGLLILGAGGLLGSELAALRKEALRPAHEELDLTERGAALAYLKARRPAAVINCAAAAGVDRCEHEPEWAYLLNARAAAELAAACKACGAHLVHISTDYVFDGRARTPLKEEAPARPLNLYGRSKRLGERAVLRQGGCVLRLQWLYGAGRRGFVDWVEACAGRGEVRAVCDCFGAPTWAREGARMALALSAARAAGVVHGACEGMTSWMGFAREVLRQTGWQAELRPALARELGRPAVRPAYTVFCLDRLRRFYAPRPWQAALRDFLKERESR